MNARARVVIVMPNGPTIGVPPVLEDLRKLADVEPPANINVTATYWDARELCTFIAELLLITGADVARVRELCGNGPPLCACGRRPTLKGWTHTPKECKPT